MPSPLRRPSRSVRVPGRVSGLVRLGHQSTGSFFVPYLERPETGDELPRRAHGPAIPPRKPDEPGTADAAPAHAAPADAAPGDVGSATADPAKADPARVDPAKVDPAKADPAKADPAKADPADGGSATAGPGDADSGVPGPADAGPPTAGSAAAPATRREAAPTARPEAAPATRPGPVPAARPVTGVPPRWLAAEPSWGAVVATTVQLWAKRRLEKPWLRALLVLVLAAVIFVAGAVTATLTRDSTTSTPGSTTESQGSTTSGQGNSASGSVTGQGAIPSDSGALAAVASARRQAVAWVAQQVNPDEVIGCDPMMCVALEAAHVQANRLLVLGPSEQDPLGSEILLDTATLRSQFGARLETVYAPVSLAAFGSGAARIEVRFSAPDGARAYRAELARDVAARKAAGTEMLRNHAIHASPAARRQLTAGQVDTRLLVAVVALAHSHPVDIISFGANQAGASPGVPLRSAEIAGAPGPGSTPAVPVVTLRSFLRSQQPPYRPSIIAVTTASRRTVLRVGYPAPSLLGLLGTHG